MNILFIHQNFPGQFKQIAPALVGKGHKVRAMTMEKVKPSVWQGVEIHPYTSSRSSSKNIHPWITDFETKVIRGEACYKACVEMKASGYVPDIIIAHPGWGESFFMKEVWPDAKLGIHCEFFYHVAGTDLGFDDEFPYSGDAIDCRIRLKNLVSMMHFDRADRGISPTQWQAGTYPEPFRERISVIHEGIDTDAIKPFDKASLTLNGKIKLSRNDEIITYVNRNLEPMRGFHIFMRALPELLKRRPKARILIPGSEAGSYGPPPKDGGTWKKQFITEVRPQISDEDWARVHFLGKIRHDHFTALLQLSTVHVYLTYPFVLSWSLIEAMSTECAIVASDTPPVAEVMQHDETGRLVNFFDKDALVNEICALLDNPAERERLGKAARAYARQHYDLKTICLPAWLDWVDQLAATT